MESEDTVNERLVTSMFFIDLRDRIIVFWYTHGRGGMGNVGKHGGAGRRSYA